MTSLVPHQDAELLKDGDSLTDVLTRLADSKVVAEAERPSTPPKIIPVTPEAMAALKRLSVDLGAVALPSERRALTDTEANHLILLHRDTKAAEKALKMTAASVKEAVFNHLDVRLEEDNEPEALPVDKNGHYLVKGEFEPKGTGLRFCRELRQAAPDITGEDLLSLYEGGKITREQYLKATRQVRVVDEEGLLKVIKTDPTILEALAEVVEPGAVTAAFTVREVKDAP